MLLYVYVFMYVQFESLKVSACLATLFCWVTHFDTWRSVYFFFVDAAKSKRTGTCLLSSFSYCTISFLPCL